MPGQLHSVKPSLTHIFLCQISHMKIAIEGEHHMLCSNFKQLQIERETHYQQSESYCVTNTVRQSNSTPRMASRRCKEIYGI